MQVQQPFQQQNQDPNDLEHTPDSILKAAWQKINQNSIQLQTYEQQLIKKDKEIEQLKEELKMQQEYSQKVQFEARLKSENRQLFDQLNQTCDELRRKLSNQAYEKDSEINSLRGEIKRLNEIFMGYKARDYQIEKYKLAITNMDENEKRYKDIIRDKDSEIDQLNKRLVKGDDNQYDEFVTRIKVMDQEIQNLQHLIVQKDKQILDSKQKIQELVEFNKIEAVKIEQRLSLQFKQNYDTLLKDKSQQFEKEMKNKTEEMIKLNNKVQFQENRLTLLENHSNKMSEITTNTKEIIDVERRFEKVKLENDELKSLKIHFAEEIQNIRRQDQSRHDQQIDQLKSQISALTSQLQFIQKDVDGFCQEIQAKDQKIQLQQREIQALKQFEAISQKREVEIEGLKATIIVLKKEIEKLYPNHSKTNFEVIQNVTNQQNQYEAQQYNPNILNNSYQRISVRSNSGINGANNNNVLSQSNVINVNNIDNAYSYQPNQPVQFRSTLQPNQYASQTITQQRQTYQY
ncbi:hypothetical protein TTHERM_00526910 (macronuclear) [Tetrahymena thermophila SB210]|uniref:Uncharacterized protein n=1 Tax=Tetrahymena thermophila (strain SB210) TaxID=312017 RepID=I7MB85_TETTS|nr:hypothetical protein TTHERM_00526910 [Tetrahymena thermophila SB210]EAS07860.1 hypothetical protein TTHERM_00526910 [Tetrahymena thermophila SB210]|eukprot:XP_001028102.1 hypothetical protein TTHERM_00526910 [Tetrahymena thermophila SB210]